MKVNQAVIVDAGMSSRFLPIVKSIPKSFLPIGGKPIVQLLIEECVEAGIEDIILVARGATKHIYEDYFNNRREDIREFLEEMGKSDRFESVANLFELPNPRIIEQNPNLPYGTAAPIISAKPHLRKDEPFLMVAGDDLVIGQERDAKTLVDAYENPNNSDIQAFMTYQEVDPDMVHKYGAIKFRDEAQTELDYIVEKPAKEEAPSFKVSYGRFLYNYNIFEFLREDRIGKDGELWNVDALTEMAKNHKVKAIPTRGKWVTTGDPKNYLVAQNMFADFEAKR